MHDHSHATPANVTRPTRLFSLAQRSVTFRIGIALVLVVLIWAAILPLVA